MKNISVIFTVRENVSAFKETLESLALNASDPSSIEFLAVIDDDDKPMLDIVNQFEFDYRKFSMRFFVSKRSEHFSKYYWNMLAKEAAGRWIIPMACDQKMLTPGWDKTINEKMSGQADLVGDDIFNGLIKDNIHRVGEDKKFPNFSCNPVLSKEHVNAVGYFFDERYWTWGCDQAVTILYKHLSKNIREWRLISLTDVSIFTYNSPHVVPEGTPEEEIRIMKENDKGFQMHIRIAQEHPCELDIPEKKDILYDREAQKLKEYINNKRNKK